MFIRIVQLDPSKTLDAENILRAPKRSSLQQMFESIILIAVSYVCTVCL